MKIELLTHNPYAGMPAPHPYSILIYGHQAALAAMRLLWEHLTPTQRQQYRDSHIPDDPHHASMKFDAVGNVTGMRYNVQYGTILSKDGHHYCLDTEVDERMPIEDQLLAKKLVIECDERKFLGTACRS